VHVFGVYAIVLHTKAMALTEHGKRTNVNRRQFLRTGVGSMLFWILTPSAALEAAEAPCMEHNELRQNAEAKEGRLLSRPSPRPQPATTPLPSGISSLGFGGKRDGLLFVPEKLGGAARTSLVVLLHGAGGTGRQALDLLRSRAEAAQLVLLAPDSRGGTWDFILGGYGPDVAILDRALGWLFERLAIDRSHLAVGGFSDGASYAMSLGLINGDLFSHVIAFSPGFMEVRRRRGFPRVFISHGSGDRVLPVTVCSRKLVPALRSAGYPVRYEEFDGGHEIPDRIRQAAVDWFRVPAVVAPAGRGNHR
jgi:phospholipase/carboxylesterase